MKLKKGHSTFLFNLYKFPRIWNVILNLKYLKNKNPPPYQFLTNNTFEANKTQKHIWRFTNCRTFAIKFNFYIALKICPRGKIHKLCTNRFFLNLKKKKKKITYKWKVQVLSLTLNKLLIKKEKSKKKILFFMGFRLPNDNNSHNKLV